MACSSRFLLRSGMPPARWSRLGRQPLHVARSSRGRYNRPLARAVHSRRERDVDADRTGATLSEGKREMLCGGVAVARRARRRSIRRVSLAALVALAVACAFASPALASGVAWEFPAPGKVIATETAVTPNELNVVYLEGLEAGRAPNAGTFVIDVEGSIGEEELEGETAHLPYGTSAKELEKALEAVKFEGLKKKKMTLAGDVEVTGGPEKAGEEAVVYFVKLKGKLAGREVVL